LQIKPEIKSDQGWEKGKQKKVNLGWHRHRKENRISAPSIHVGALVGAGALWPLRWWKPLASWPNGMGKKGKTKKGLGLVGLFVAANKWWVVNK
jgi:hypothetical protein